MVFGGGGGRRGVLGCRFEHAAPLGGVSTLLVVWAPCPWAHAAVHCLWDLA